MQSHMTTSTRMRCPRCGAEMNHHASKVDYSAGHDEPGAIDPVFNGVLQEVHQCAVCGNIELRRRSGDVTYQRPKASN
jgi:uncharacterized protein (DUF983 family)